MRADVVIERAEFLYVFPCGTFPVRITQQRGGVIGDHERDALIGMHRRAQGRQGSVCPQQGLRCDSSERQNYFRLQQRQLPVQIWFALLDFGGERVPIAGRAAFENVADKNILALELHGFENLVQQLPSATDEGFSLSVFFRTWGLTDENDIGSGISDTEDKVAAGFTERTIHAFMNHRVEFSETSGCFPGFGHGPGDFRQSLRRKCSRMQHLLVYVEDVAVQLFLLFEISIEFGHSHSDILIDTPDLSVTSRRLAVSRATGNVVNEKIKYEGARRLSMAAVETPVQAVQCLSRCSAFRSAVIPAPVE